MEGHSCIQIETIPIPPNEGRNYPHKTEDTWITNNIKVLYHYDELKTVSFAHVRVGLAKPYYKQENHCFLMCNGVFLF